MLERTSRFVLETLPYVLAALIAAIILPQFLYSQAHGTRAAVTSKISYVGTFSSGLQRNVPR